MNNRFNTRLKTQTERVSGFIVKSGIKGLIKGVHELLVKRAALGILFITSFSTLSIFIIWWSLSERISVIDEKNAKMSALAVIEHEVLELEKSWSDDDFEKLMGDISESERYIFPHYTRVAEWLFDEAGFAKQAGLGLKYYLSDVVADNELEGVEMVPIKIQLKSLNTGSNNGYWKMMDFLKRMDRTTWKHEIVTVNMGSEGEGASKMDIQFNVWMKAPNIRASFSMPTGNTRWHLGS